MIGQFRLGRNALFAIFTLSGFSGLIYESIWSHYLKLFLGHAAYAQTLVLTIFMGGMALGAWVAARRSLHLRNLLVAYAAVEALTGTLALVFHPVYVGSVNFAFDVVAPSIEAAWTFNTLKWTYAALLILPQSVLLGMTFPLISGAVIRRFPDRPGATLAMLYFTNSLGAALGVLVSGFWLIEWVGLPGTVMTAGIVNLVLAAFVWLFAGTEASADAKPTSVVPQTAENSLFARKILAAAFLAGVASFIYEIGWIRMLSMVLGSSTHAFELMLSAFILGLALGGLWIRNRVDRLAEAPTALAVMFTVMALLATLTLPAYGATFDIVAGALRMFEATDAGYAGFNVVSHAIAAAIMIPTTFVAGMTLPVMTHALLRVGDERVIGKVYACNTVGAIVGVIIAVHLLLPLVGTKGAIVMGALIQLGAATMLLRSQSRWLSLRVGYGLAAGLFVVLAISLAVRFDPLRMASGVYRVGQARLPDEAQVTYLRDGKTATISVARLNGLVVIATNGKPDAALNMGSGLASADEITMTLAAALPLAMHGAPRRVANIGIGSGLTSHVLLGSSEVRSLDSIEIEPAMAEGARHAFGTRVARLFDDPRSRIHFEDAKTFFSISKQKYDVIVSEPSNPWISGVATLFSNEFYTQISSRLTDDGLLVQWIQIYETDLTIVASIIKALSPHFADYELYSTDDANIVIVATKAQHIPPLHSRIYATPALAADLQRVGLNTIGDIELRRIGGKRLLDSWFAMQPAPANSDFFPYVDLNAPRMRFLGRDALALVELGRLPVPVSAIFGLPLLNPATESPTGAQYFEKQRLASEAHAVFIALRSGNLDALTPENARDILALDLPTDRCRSAGGRLVWIGAVHGLSSRTTPFVPANETAPLWARVRASGCMTQIAPGERNWVEMLAATAAGDNAALASSGSKLFIDPPRSLSANQTIEALLATASAMILTGQRNDAVALFGAYVPLLSGGGRYTLALQILASKLGAPTR